MWKLCLALALAPVAAHGGDVRVSIRAPWIVPAALAALFPPTAPLQPSPLLNSGPLKVQLKDIEPSGIRIVTLEGNG